MRNTAPLLIAISLLGPAAATEPSPLVTAVERLRSVHDDPRGWGRVPDLAPVASNSLAALRAVAADPQRSAWERTAALTLLGASDTSGRARELAEAFQAISSSQRRWHAPRFRQFQGALEAALDPATEPVLRLRPDDLPWLTARALIERDGLATLALGYTADPRALPVLLCVGRNRLAIGGLSRDPARVALIRLCADAGVRRKLAKCLVSPDVGPVGRTRTLLTLLVLDDPSAREPLQAWLQAVSEHAVNTPGDQGPCSRDEIWTAALAVTAHPHPSYREPLAKLAATRAKDEQSVWQRALEACR